MVISSERRMTNDDLVGQDTERPPVDHEIVALFRDKFWCKIFWRAYECVGTLIRLQFLRDAVIDQSYITILANEHILRLQVPKNDILLMQMSKTQSNLQSNHFSTLLRKTLLL